MIKINGEKKTILFHKEFKLGEEPAQTIECDLISGYICPRCKQILLAYFKSNEFIPVWKYDEKNKDKEFKSSNFLKYYRYHVFYSGNGLVGIELKEHNKYGGCTLELVPGYNLIFSVNKILEKLEKEINSHYLENIEKTIITKLSDSFNKEILFNNLVNNKIIKLVEGICDNDDPLIEFDYQIEYGEISTYQFKYKSPEDKAAELLNYKNKKEAYLKVVHSLIKNGGEGIK